MTERSTRQRPWRMILLAAVLAIALLVAGLWWLQDHFSDPVPGGRGTAAADVGPAAAQISAPLAGLATDKAASPAPTSAQPPSAEPTTSSALPAADLPLTQTFDTLAQRARDGDVVAARRLYSDVTQCRSTSTRPEAPTHIELAQARSGDPMTLHMRVQACLARALCEGTSSAQLHDPTQWLWAAAQGGDMDARMLMAAGLFLHRQDLDAFAYVPQMRANGLRWLQEAAAAGRRDAVTLLGAAYLAPEATYGDPLGELVPYDPVLGLAYHLADLRSRRNDRTAAEQIQTVMQRAGERLSRAEVTAADRLAAEVQRGLQPDSGIFETFERTSGLQRIPASADARCISTAAEAVLRERLEQRHGSLL